MWVSEGREGEGLLKVLLFNHKGCYILLTTSVATPSQLNA